MIVRDYTIPEAEVIYQKAVIQGAWKMFYILALCVFVYFVVWKIVEDRKDARAHKLFLARIRADKIIGQAGFDAIIPKQAAIIDRQNKTIEKQRKHIAMLESTLDKFSLEDARDRIRQEMKQQQSN